MADNDYICVYRQFFEEFAKTSQIQDCMPMRVNPYNLSVDELVGEVMQSCVNYLIEKKCPRSLVVPLTKIVVEEFINEAKKQPEEVSTPLELNKKTHFKISEVCLRYTDNEKLSNLPAPVNETQYSTHSTKHTRRRMEDRLICLPRFNTLHSIENSSEAGYYGIFDGHSGVTAASYAVSHLHQFLAESEHYPDDPVQAFRQAFEKTELKFNSKDENCGTAALAILLQHSEKKLTVAWVGDSQAMLVNSDSYVMLVDPHKPERADERKRIEDLGGYLINMQSIFRVNGLLAISRAIGDKKLKPYISAEPEIRVVNLTGSEHFIVMGCDGLWDVVEPQQVIETVYFEIRKHEGQIDSVARRLVDLAKENNSTDNISVIVIFLTDPAEIKNLPIDVTGHRPKILHQDGVIMEANCQTNEKSAFGDAGMNGVYEANGNHFDIQNGSDEDFGPETDVDAVDDVLTSPKALNPFSKDWQKMGEENSEKLIEFTCQESKGFGDDFVKFSEEFPGSVKPADDNNSSQFGNVNSDKFSVDNVNPFGAPKNTSEASEFSCNFSDVNKYLDEINSKKEEVDLTGHNFSQPFELKNEENFLNESQNKANSDLYCFDGNDAADAEQIKEVPALSATPTRDSDVFSHEEIPGRGDDVMPVESPLQTVSEPGLMEEPELRRQFSKDNSESQQNETNERAHKVQDIVDVTSESNDGHMDLIEQSVPQEAGGYPQELCSVIDVVEVANVSPDLRQMEDGGLHNSKDGIEPSPELYSPTAPVLDGEAKDEIIGESGGEVEDSEDDEWNYIKVDSGSQQTIPLDTKASDLVLPSNGLPAEVPKMNSPLNPEADEFIPVSAKTNDNEFNLNITPKKAIPGDLTDIIASSPNWNNMNNVSVPEEEAFLKEIKSRPSNIFENVESPQKESFDEKINELNNTSPLVTIGGIEHETEFSHPTKQPQGLDFATDMTSSFIDPSTIGSEIESVQEKPDLMASPINEEIVEKKELVLNESPAKANEKPVDVEPSSKLPDLLSPVSVQEDFSPIDNSKPTEIEASVPAPSEPVMSNITQSPVENKLVDTTPVMSPSSNEELLSQPVTLPETPEKASPEEKPKEVISPKTTEAAVAAVGAATAVAAAGVAAAKKDAKKPAPKTTTTTSKAPLTSKPLVNGTKTTAPAKKPTPTPTPRAPLAGKTAGATTTGSATKTTTTSRVSTVTKTKPTTVSSTLTKTAARPTLTSAVSASKTSTPPKPAVTTSPTKSSPTTMKSAARTPSSAPAGTTLKPKPRLPSATLEKKTTTAVNGDAKPLVKRTEVTTKRVGGVTTTTTTTTTRVSSAPRPATVPLKPMTVKTTVTTTRTVTAKPRTTVTSTTTSTPLNSSNRTSVTARKSTIGADKQAKEVANRLTSKTGLASKTAGNATGTMKTRKTMTTTTTTTTKMKNDDKTETKAEKIVEVEITQSENGIPLIENKTDINLINSIASEQTA